MDIIIGLSIVAVIIGAFLFLASMGKRGSSGSGTSSGSTRRRGSGGGGSGDDLP